MAVAKIGVPDECVSSFLGDTMELKQGREGAPGWYPEPTFLEGSSIVYYMYASLKCASVVKATGQISKESFFTEGLGKCLILLLA